MISDMRAAAKAQKEAGWPGVCTHPGVCSQVTAQSTQPSPGEGMKREGEDCRKRCVRPLPVGRETKSPQNYGEVGLPGKYGVLP